METLIMKYGLITLPTVLTGLYLLRVLQKLYQEKSKQKRQPAPITIRRED